MAAVFSMMAVFGLLTAIFDMGMNGSAYAGWAPYGFVIAFIGLGGCWWMGAL
jgi:hypothetical protein